MTLDDLRRLNLKEIGSWPWPAKLLALALIVAVVVGLGAALDWREQWSALDRAREEEEKLKSSWLTKKQQAINLDLYVAQLKEIEQQFGALLKQLPNRNEMDALLVDINQAGLSRGLQFELFKPARQENMADFYAELPISIRVTGNYHDMGAFASDVSLLSRIVTLNDVDIKPDKGGALSMEVTARTFRYLDEDEVAKQRAAAKEAEKKGRK